ncbi:atp-dependent RNA helicase ddx49-related [Anaeramoeba flamelloides]|uniref:Atp-dependent RNA helicase ddx49-related n=1 Tax=Anaeramoeba flamelloides TaxID=1746091 RepID=A0AAV7ZUW1_9EUKA|nr:atp-dependent RNA helicase ddx49-related [Anaeramoeba flamelloides]
MSSTFKSLGLTKWICKLCDEMGYTSPTTIQSSTIPSILSGNDVIGGAETGSGKTAAFALPIVQTLSKDPYGIYCLVLTPTHELAFQIADQFKVFGSQMGIRVAVIVGGLDMMEQALVLETKPHIVVATPGRLADHLRSTTTCSLKKIKYLVCDEADRLITGSSLIKPISEILDYLPKNRQNLFFTATICDELLELKNLSDKNRKDKELKIFTSTKQKIVKNENGDLTATEMVYQIPKTLSQQYVFLPRHIRDCYLVELLQQLKDSTSESRSIMIFTFSCEKCQLISKFLNNLSYNNTPLNSLMNQRERIASLRKFKSGKVKILVATDVASRGLDIPLIDIVINHNIPSSPINYIHRIGRTGRAERYGRAISLISQYDINKVQKIEEKIEKKMELFDIDEKDVLQLLGKVTKAKRAAKMELEENQKYKSRKRKKEEMKNKILKKYRTVNKKKKERKNHTKKN